MVHKMCVFLELADHRVYITRHTKVSTLYFSGLEIIQTYRSVPQIHSSFAILALVQNAGGAYTRDVTISFAITPSLPVKHNLIFSGGWGPSATRRDAPDTSGRLMSFSFERQGSRVLPRNSWRVHRWCGQSVFTVDINYYFNCRMSLLLGGGVGGLCAG